MSVSYLFSGLRVYTYTSPCSWNRASSGTRLWLLLETECEDFKDTIW